MAKRTGLGIIAAGVVFLGISCSNDKFKDSKGLDKQGIKEFKMLLDESNRPLTLKAEMVEYVKNILKSRGDYMRTSFKDSDYKAFIDEKIIPSRIPVSEDGTVKFDDSPELTFNIRQDITDCKNSTECGKKINDLFSEFMIAREKMIKGTATEKDRDTYYSLLGEIYSKRVFENDFSIFHTALKACLLKIDDTNCRAALLGEEIAPSFAYLYLTPLYARLCLEQGIKDYCGKLADAYMYYVYEKYESKKEVEDALQNQKRR